MSKTIAGFKEDTKSLRAAAKGKIYEAKDWIVRNPPRTAAVVVGAVVAAYVLNSIYQGYQDHNQFLPYIEAMKNGSIFAYSDPYSSHFASSGHIPEVNHLMYVGLPNCDTPQAGQQMVAGHQVDWKAVVDHVSGSGEVYGKGGELLGNAVREGCNDCGGLNNTTFIDPQNHNSTITIFKDWFAEAMEARHKMNITGTGLNASDIKDYCDKCYDSLGRRLC